MRAGGLGRRREGRLWVGRERRLGAWRLPLTVSSAVSVGGVDFYSQAPGPCWLWHLLHYKRKFGHVIEYLFGLEADYVGELGTLHKR